MEKCKGILVDIDALFDVKLPLASLLDIKHVTKDLESNTYFTRYRDNIGNVSSDILHSFLRVKNKNLYKLAVPTPILTEILPIDFQELSKFDSIEREYGLPSIYVNIYPYDFKDEDMKRFNYIICKHIPYSEVIFINKSFDYLTPSWIKQYITHMYLVRGLEWVEYNINNKKLPRKPLVEVMLITPTLFEGYLHSSTITTDFITKIKEQVAPLINIEFCSTELFSADKNFILGKHEENDKVT